MIEDSALRHRAHELIRAGKLPARRPDRVWGGSAFGGHRCILCSGLIEHEQVAMEIEFAREAEAKSTTGHLHTRCFLALELELLQKESEGPAHGLAAPAPKPSGAPNAFEPHEQASP